MECLDWEWLIFFCASELFIWRALITYMYKRKVYVLKIFLVGVFVVNVIIIIIVKLSRRIIFYKKCIRKSLLINLSCLSSLTVLDTFITFFPFIRETTKRKEYRNI